MSDVFLACNIIKSKKGVHANDIVKGHFIARNKWIKITINMYVFMHMYQAIKLSE